MEFKEFFSKLFDPPPPMRRPKLHYEQIVERIGFENPGSFTGNTDRFPVKAEWSCGPIRIHVYPNTQNIEVTVMPNANYYTFKGTEEFENGLVVIKILHS